MDPILTEIVQYLLKKNKVEWANHIAELILNSNDSDSDSEYEIDLSDEEGHAVKEEEYKVIIDPDGHQRLF